MWTAAAAFLGAVTGVLLSQLVTAHRAHEQHPTGELVGGVLPEPETDPDPRENQ